MRKVTIEFRPNEMVREHMDPFFEKIERMEGLELLKLDFESGMKVAVAKFTMREGFGIEEIEVPGHSEIIGIIEQRGNEYTCIVRGFVQDSMRPLMEEFRIDVIWDTPMMATAESIVYSAIGTEEDIRKLMEALKLIGEVIIVSYHRAAFEGRNHLAILTEKQREVMIAAKKRGYYQYPRRVKAEDLADGLGISKATAVEHLRKAEIRLMDEILAGY